MTIRKLAKLRWAEIGQEQYGDYDPATDPRDLVGEAEDEMADVDNYVYMAELKYGEAPEWDQIRALMEIGSRLMRDAIQRLEGKK